MSKFFAFVLVISFAGAGMASAEDAPAPKENPAAKADAYPLKTCIVSGEKFGGDMGEPVTITHEGRTIKFCCDGCIKKFKADPAKYLKVLDEAEKKAKEESTKNEKAKDGKTKDAKDGK